MVEVNKLYDQSRTGLQPVVLTNPFSTNQHMIVGTHNPRPQQGGNHGNPSQGVDPLVANIFMFQKEVEMKTKSNNYDMPILGNHDKEGTSSQLNPLQIE